MQVRAALPSEYPAVTEITVAAYVDGGYIPPDADYATESPADRS